MGLRLEHRIALARELTYAAGCPLRDRYGYAASHYTVERLLEIISAAPDVEDAVIGLGVANLMDDKFQIAEDDGPTSEETDLKIVTTLWEWVKGSWVLK